MNVIKPGEAQYLKALIYGPSGHGKTTLLATAQLDHRTSPALLLDFEGGTQSLRGLDIDVAVIRSWRDYEEIYGELRTGRHGYRSVLLDSLSETATFGLLDILEKEGKSRKGDPDVLQVQDYGKMGVQMRRLVRYFRDLPLHVLMSALSRTDTEPGVGTVKKPSIGTSTMSDEIPGIFDVVGYLALSTNEAGEEIRTLLINNVSKYRVKARTPWASQGIIPDYIDNATVTELLNALQYA